MQPFISSHTTCEVKFMIKLTGFVIVSSKFVSHHFELYGFQKSFKKQDVNFWLMKSKQYVIEGCGFKAKTV